jgi:hypothetical protein
MLYQSTSIDPVSDHDLVTEHLGGGALIVRNRAGEVVQTADLLGIRRDFGREAFTGKLLVRKLGVWTKLDGGCLDAAGTLFYRKGDLEIQERLNGVHIHTNKRTGVSIQTDHVKHGEVIKQANGEVWKREVDAVRELFEMWLHDRLKYRSQTFTEPRRLEAETINGKQALIYVSRMEQSFEHGMIAREKYCFRNPLTGESDITLTAQIDGKLSTVRNVQAVVTTFIKGSPAETVYGTKGGAMPTPAHLMEVGRQQSTTAGETQINFTPGTGTHSGTYR